MGSLQGKPKEIISTNSYSGPDSPPEDKPYRPRGLWVWESLTTVVKFASGYLLYAYNEVIGYKLILTLQEGSPAPQSLSLAPVVATVVVGWMTRSHWYPESPIFNQLDEQESNKQHELQIITLMDNPSGGHTWSTGTWGQGQSFTTHSFTSSSHYSPTNYRDSGYGNDGGWPVYHSHTYTGICWAMPCGGYRCQYAPPPQQYQEQTTPLHHLNWEHYGPPPHIGPDSTEEQLTYVCTEPGCNKKYAQQRLLTQHQKRSHPREEQLTYVCTEPGCNKKYAQQWRLTQHQKRSHPREEQLTYVCTEPGCNKKYAQQGRLTQHQKRSHHAK